MHRSIKGLPPRSAGISLFFLAFCASLTLIGFFPLILLFALSLLMLSALCYSILESQLLKGIAWLLMFFCGIFLALYRPDGFSYIQLIAVEELHEGGKAFSQYLNLGKLLGAICVAVMLLLPRVRKELSCFVSLKSLVVIPLAVFLVLVFAAEILNMGYVPKHVSLTTVCTFLAYNLFVTSFSEEVFIDWSCNFQQKASFRMARSVNSWGCSPLLSFLPLRISW